MTRALYDRAEEMIEDWGWEAANKAAQAAEDCKEDGDLAAWAEWRQVYDLILLLQDDERPKGATLN